MLRIFYAFFYFSCLCKKSGDVDAFELRARDSSVVITGSGNCRTSVSDTLQAKITGSGDVLYKGYPEIKQTITGSGSLRDRN
jgi:hypothetical protein